MIPDWRLEAMRAADLHGVLAIERLSFQTPWPAEAFLADPADSPWSRSLVLRDARRPEAGVRGYICFWTLEGELDIQNVAVHPDDRRRGGARAMLERAFEEGRAAGCDQAWLEVRTGNAAAIALYGAFGFVPVGRRRRYYEDTGEDAIVMRAPVGGPPAFLKAPRNG